MIPNGNARAGGAVTALPLQSLTGERGPGAVAQQPFECGAILGLDEYTRVHREPAAVLPALEISDGIGPQTAVTPGGAQYAMTNRPLHRREVDLTQAGRMKAKLRTCCTKQPIRHAYMKVRVGVQGGTKALWKTHRSATSGSGCVVTRASQLPLDHPQRHAPYGAQQLRIAVLKIP